MQRLHRNQGGYQGETIDIQSVLRDVQSAALEHGWSQEVLLDDGTMQVCAFHRSSPGAARRFYLSSGMHGDEPAGPLAMLELLRTNDWPSASDFWLCPCLNPTGFPLNTRENAQRVDLNRDYRHLSTSEVRAHVAWLKKQPSFDLTLLLHEDWEAGGFYVYELNQDERTGLAEAIIQRVAQFCPIESATEVDGFAIHQGIIRPKLRPEDRPQWPEAIYLFSEKTRQGYTLEAPSDYPLPLRVAAHVAAVRSALETFNRPPGRPAL